MIATLDKRIDYQKYISLILVAYAFSFPISKAATNLFEILAILLWIIEGNWREKYELYKHNLLSIAIISLIGFSSLSILWHGNAELTLRYVAKYRHLLIIFVFYSSFDKKYTSTILSAFLLSMFLSELVSYGIYFELIHYKNIFPHDPTPFMRHMTYITALAFTITILLVCFFTVSIANIKHKIKAILLSFSMLIITFALAYNFSPNFQIRSNQLYDGLQSLIQNNNYNGVEGRRIALTIIGVHTFLDHPIAGAGLSYSMQDAKNYANLSNINLQNLSSYADYHSTFLTVSTQLGIIGLLISLMIIYTLFSLKIIGKEWKLLSLIKGRGKCSI